MSMLITTYKYNPAEFNHILGLSDDLTTFYTLYNEYTNNKTQSKCFALEKQGEELFFTIKHLTMPSNNIKPQRKMTEFTYDV